MHLPRPRFTLATQILSLQLVVLAFTVTAGTATSLWLARNQLDEQYRQRALAVAETVASLPEVQAAVVSPDGAAIAQPLAEAIRRTSGASFVVVTDRLGIRLSHPNPELIGKSVNDPGEPAIALTGRPYTATESGSLGVSARGKAPVFDAAGQVIGMVSVGYPELEVNAGLFGVLPFMAGYLLIALAIGSGAAWLLARHLKRQTFGLEPHEIATLLEQREAMLHGIREGAVAMDRSNRLTLINDEARRLLGLDTDVVGSSVEDVFPAGRVRDVLAGTVDGSDLLVLADGRILVANRMPVVVRDEIVGSVTTFRDRTELSGLRRELQGNRGVTEALRAQVHEFSNRLHTIAGLIELGRGEEAIGLATEAASLHQELAERLLERIGEPQLSALLLAKASVASERAIELRLSDDTLLSDAVPDPQNLVTILGNLIDNAFDAVRSNPAGADRWVDIEVRDDAQAVVIRVADSGPGVDPVLADRIFAEGFTTKDGDGRTRGLGLALVRQIVERRGGTIAVTNGPGAIFTVRLPRREASPAAVTAPTRTAANGPAVVPPADAARPGAPGAVPRNAANEPATST